MTVSVLSQVNDDESEVVLEVQTNKEGKYFAGPLYDDQVYT